jgi:hypothetical protein
VPGTNIQLSPACLNVLHGLLERDPFRCLGCYPNGQGLNDIHHHTWFAELDWAALASKSVPSACVSDPKEANFDPTHELDKLLMLEKPLSKNSRKKGIDIEKMSPERRELELDFTVHDFSAMQRMTYFPPDDSRSRHRRLRPSRPARRRSLVARVVNHHGPCCRRLRRRTLARTALPRSRRTNLR